MKSKEAKVQQISEKVTSLNTLQPFRSLTLPSHCYGPICLKILSDFVDHHNLPKGMLMPVPGLTNHESLSRIFDVILHSLGEVKRLEIMKELDEYIASLPPPPKKSVILQP